MIMLLIVTIFLACFFPGMAIPVIGNLEEKLVPVPINCVVIGDYQTAINGDPTSSKEGDLVASVLRNLFNDTTIDFHASLNYFGYSSFINDEDSVEFATMLGLSDLNGILSALRDPSFPFPSSLADFVDWLNDLSSFDASNRCLLFFSAVTDVTAIQLIKTGIYDSIIAVGLNENTAFPFTATSPALPIPWIWSSDDAQAIADLVKSKFTRAVSPASPTTSTKPPPTTITKFTTQTLLTTTSGSQSGFDTQCKCDTESVWNDVMFVIDRSNETGSDGLSEMYDTMLTLLYFFNVQAPGTNDVGVVFYNSEAVLAASLGSSSQDLFNLNTDDFYQKNDKGIDLEKGLRLAIDQFDPTNPNRRLNARKVIVVMATTYSPAGVDAPQTVAAQFRDDNGILIIYDYIEEHGEPALSLGELASPGFAMNSIQNGIDDLANVQCSANCFCQLNYSPFTSDERTAPTAGCYKTVDIPANELLAERNCLNRHKGLVVEIEDETKNEFVGNLIKPASDTLIGLKWNATLAEWRWLDGTVLSSYSNFDLSSAHYPGRDCVYMEKNTNLWKTVDCRQGFKYICESKPCDSMNYCDGEE